MEIGVISADRKIQPLLRLVGHDASEITGLAFGPGGRLYFSSQRGTIDDPTPVGVIGQGVTFEVRGPFHGGTALPAAANDGNGIVSGLVHNTVEPPVRSLNPSLGDTVHTVDRTIRRLGL
jgi:hypothetical protein